MPTTDPGLPSDGTVPLQRPWSATEREDFFAAIARHRRAAWRVTAACALAYGLLAVVVAILLAPLLYSVLGLALDVINLVVPVPDLLGYAARTINALVESTTAPSPIYVTKVAALAAVPGFVLMGVAAAVLRRALMRSALFNSDKLTGRAPDAGELAEQRFSNTTEEMALAASIPAPRVVILAGGANAAAFGPDEQHATIMVGETLIETLNREQMQGVAGHLIASVADGDMRIGLRTAMTLGLFSLMARLSAGWTDRAAYLSSRRLVRALITPTAANLDVILAQLSDPFAADPEGEKDQKSEQPPTFGDGDAKRASGELTWKEWALMPLMGPVFLSGFLSGLVNTMMLTPAIAFAWRQRKYMADATAVRLTRDPNALAGALSAISRSRGSTQTAAWAGHLCVVDPGTKRDAGLLGGSFVSIFPSLQRRIEALVKMGAAAPSPLPHRPRMPLLAVVLIAGLATIVAFLLGTVVVLLVLVSAALSGIFTLMPAAVIHALLR
jgi:Zn-dependent protease with chaperone function